jgi:hypothetical protein
MRLPAPMRWFLSKLAMLAGMLPPVKLEVESKKT